MEIVVPLRPLKQLKFAVRTLQGNTDSLRSVGLLLLVNHLIILFSAVVAVTNPVMRGIIGAVGGLVFACFSIGVTVFVSAETEYLSGYRHRWGAGIMLISAFGLAFFPDGILKLVVAYIALGTLALELVLSIASIFIPSIGN